ncbi:MFS transporter [Ilumatobacter nonamiensis]|uniref:MFS transporter n=1 Tax=Ilumatobacter nonamiensis TaxID=467093 RepID=UPI000348056A|nr:MFS transporter [Ilumatobacter nonamiensis]
MSKFTRLAVTHALMMAGDAAMVVALADSFFFSVDLDSARTQVLLFLAISFAPFLFIAPLIGPLIDRMAGGRRLVIQVVAIFRVLLLLLMAQDPGGLELFPLVFASLVLQKTYAVSKSALVPSTVRSETELVEANSKLGLISGIAGAVAVIPAGILLTLLGTEVALIYGALIFVGAFLSARRLAPEVVAAHDAGEVEELELHSPSLRVAAIAMTVLRADVGFTFFHLAFWLRTFDNGTALFGASIAASAGATMVGNAIAPRVRQRMREETMLTVVLAMSAVAGIGLAVIGSPGAGIVLAGVVGFAAALGRLGFESIVQRDAPEANQGRAFARFETRFQFAWAAAGFIAVAIQLPGAIGLMVVGVVAAGTMLQLRFRDAAIHRRPRRSRRRLLVSKLTLRSKSKSRRGSRRRSTSKGASRSRPNSGSSGRSGKRTPADPFRDAPSGDRQDDVTPRRVPRVQARDPEPRSRSESESPRDR